MASFLFFESLPSTMDEARIRALQGVEEGFVVIAYKQSQGRGRRGHVWESLLGNLYLTYITYLNCSLLEAPQLSFVACVAVGEGLRSTLPPGHLLLYKWPNDLLLNGKKVAGLLLESVAIPEREEMSYLIGCGLNLTSCFQYARYPTTSFQNEGIYLPLNEALQKIAASLQYYICLWKREGFSPIHDLWMKNVSGLETKINFDHQGAPQTGIFKGIDKEGALILETSQGLKKFTAGEVL